MKKFMSILLVTAIMFTGCSKGSSKMSEGDAKKVFEYEECDGGLSIESLVDDTKTINVKIPSSINGKDVVQIGFGAFSDHVGGSKVESVSIPDTVKVIESEAFYSCDGLKKVSMGKNVEEIEDEVFKYCDNLESFTIPESVKEIGCEIFESTYSLKEVVINAKITEIPQGTFSYSNIEKVNIPDSVTTIGEEAFYNCEKLKELEIPDSVTEIDESAFEDTDLTIICSKGSYAEKFAEENNIKVSIK